MRSVVRTPSRQLPPPDVGSERIITLEQVRPYPRCQNEYVDGPKVHPPGCLKSPTPGGTLSSSGISTVNRVALPVRSVSPSGLRALNPNIITVTQPVSISPPLKKDALVDKEDKITCGKCGKCRCGSCTEPQPLPSRWLCGDKCKVSAESALETCTCFCCVSGIFYHCGKDDEDADYVCYTDPCACCSKPHCCQRWTCMAMMALCLPCLWCYWPAKGALKASTYCYNRCRKKGCQCSKKVTKKPTVHEKNGSQSRGLLIDSDSSSA